MLFELCVTNQGDAKRLRKDMSTDTDEDSERSLVCEGASGDNNVMRRLEGLCKQLCDVSNQLRGLVSTVAEIREDITDIKTKVDRHDTLLIDLKTKVETNEKLVKDLTREYVIELTVASLELFYIVRQPR